ncbi:hypothetical protein H0H81_009347 [Sphagnurus paluster]|uniref:SET domain-containing protein n=1 Tax=Sphagnurus paluster TaxID=117069 RepID=A0A9P7FPP8_9AGAR|nr:hypothetical protein H0H81_009347 [Sphagnurus paluster]
MFATCDIKMGELVLSERPLLLTPAAIPMLGDTNLTDARSEEVHRCEYEQVLQRCVNLMLPKNRTAFFKLHDAHTKDGSGHISGRTRTNGIGAMTEKSQEEKRMRDYGYSTVFNEISYINHSCLPNASAKFSALSLSSGARTIRDIKQGEEIFISYCKPEIPTAERQAQLKSYDFQCTCDACSGPSSDMALGKIQMSVAGMLRLDGEHGLMYAELLIKEIERKWWYYLEQYGTYLGLAAMCGKELKNGRIP